MRPSSREPTTAEITNLRVLCLEKADETGLTDPKQILRAVMRELSKQGRKSGTLAQRLKLIEPNLLDHAVQARQTRNKRHSTERQNRRRARKANVDVESVNRAEIIRRDRSTCYICGLHCKPHEIHLDHVIPLAKGGAHTADNLRVACSTCNIRKGSSLPSAIILTADGNAVR